MKLRKLLVSQSLVTFLMIAFLAIASWSWLTPGSRADETENQKSIVQRFQAELNRAPRYVFDGQKFQNGLVDDTTKGPYSSICLVERIGEDAFGTGVLIAPDTVLTAAHVVLGDREGASAEQWPSQIVNPYSLSIRPAYAGLTGNVKKRFPFGKGYQATSVAINPRYFRAILTPGEDPSDFDLAVIHLNRPVEGAPVLSLGSFAYRDLGREPVMVAGYPATLGTGHTGGPVNQEMNMYADTGTIAGYSEHQLITTNINWTHGDSGAPLLNSHHEIIGIVSTSSSLGNFATRLEPHSTCWVEEQLTPVRQRLTPETVDNRWVQLGSYWVWFDGEGFAREVRLRHPNDLAGGGQPGPSRYHADL